MVSARCGVRQYPLWLVFCSREKDIVTLISSGFRSSVNKQGTRKKNVCRPTVHLYFQSLGSVLQRVVCVSEGVRL
jgi:hypothetical protein